MPICLTSLQICFRCKCNSGHLLSFRNGRLRLGNLQRSHLFPRSFASLVRFRPRSGFCIPVAVGGLGGDRAGEDTERNGHVYGRKCVLPTVRYIGGVGIRRVFVHRGFVFVVGVSSGLFYNQRLSFSSLIRECLGCVKAQDFNCVPYVD